jgi:hypothetical protein
VELTTVLIAIILAASGCALIVVLAFPLVASLLGAAIGSKSKLGFRKASSALQKADSFIQRSQWKDALAAVQQAVVFDQVYDRQIISALSEHHQNVLSRLLLVAEGLTARPQNIADLERLFMERTELLVLHLKAIEAYKRLKSRRVQSGKAVPSWSRGDFDKRSAEIQTELKRNQNALADELRKLTAHLLSPPKDQVTLH